MQASSKISKDDAAGAEGQLASDIAEQSLEHPTETSKAADDLANGTVEEDGEASEEDDEAVADGQAADATSAARKKKRKPRKKKKKTTADASSTTDAPPTAAAASTATTQPATTTTSKQMPVHDIESLINQLALSQSATQKKEGKAQEDYKFWNTQPVPKFSEPEPEPDLMQTTSASKPLEGEILPSKVCRATAKSEPDKLLDGFEWVSVDMESEEEVKEVYELLDGHYVEDADASFRFRYSGRFLEWALKPPGWKREWHIGVRTSTTAKEQGEEGESKKGKLVAFIAATPVTLLVGDATLNSTEINFLAIHRKLRGKRLAPELIKEVTRRCYVNEIFQALYTAGTLLPTPVTTCRYYHRSLDWEHLYNHGFSHLPPGSSLTKQRLKYKVPSQPQLKGLRPMKEEDVPAVKLLLERYLERFHLRQKWSEEEVRYWFCSERSKGVVWAWVVEDEKEARVTDFVSYYLLESTVLKSNNRTVTIKAAYLFYYATDAAFPPPATSTSAFSYKPPTEKQLQQKLAPRLDALVHDALILAKKDDFHVFNALTLMDNPLFLKEQKFEPGDGKLHYYLFNWRTRPLGGGVDEKNQIDPTKMGGIGIMML